jgi:hypothetical protein
MAATVKHSAPPKAAAGLDAEDTAFDIASGSGLIGCLKGTPRSPYQNYEFHLEYSRDLPQPHFVSGGLREPPIGGGAMGGMGGMGGGFRSVKPDSD